MIRPINLLLVNLEATNKWGLYSLFSKKEDAIFKISDKEYPRSISFLCKSSFTILIQYRLKFFFLQNSFCTFLVHEMMTRIWWIEKKTFLLWWCNLIQLLLLLTYLHVAFIWQTNGENISTFTATMIRIMAKVGHNL